MKARIPTRLAACAALLLTAGAAQAQRMHVQGLIGEPPDLAASTWPHPAAPDGNPFPRSTAPPADIFRRDTKALLGKTLFWEEQVGIDKTMACGTCHDPGAAGADGRGPAPHASGTFGSFGVIPQEVNQRPTGPTIDYGFVTNPNGAFARSVTPIIAPPMIGAYMFERLFWDMRAGPAFRFEGPPVPPPPIIPNFADFAALEQLATGPPLSDVEMGHFALTWGSGTLQAHIGGALPLALCDPNPAKMPPDLGAVIGLNLDYNTLFDLVFGSDPDPTLALGPGVTRERFAAAVAHYMRTLIPDRAPIDLGTMTANQQAGFQIASNGTCFTCHSVGFGVALTNPAGGFQDPFDAPLSDGQFHNIRGLTVKTPTLRNVGLKKHFFTDGQVMDMLTLVNFYDLTFGLNLNNTTRGQLIDFLANALTDPRVAGRTFPFDKPELASERPEHAFEGNEFGFPISGTTTPEMLANAPAFVPDTGRTSFFKIGLANCIPGNIAILGLQFPPSTSFSFLPVETISTAGFATTHFPIPAQTGSALIGLTAVGRWFVQDAQAPGGIAESRSARWTLFQL